MGSTLVAALGLMLVVEGLMPLVSPVQLREAMLRISAMRDGLIRLIGLAAMVVGLVLLASAG